MLYEDDMLPDSAYTALSMFEYIDDKGSGSPAKCRYCGATNVEWHKWDKKWRLLETNGTYHRCPEYMRDR